MKTEKIKPSGFIISTDGVWYTRNLLCNFVPIVTRRYVAFYNEHTLPVKVDVDLVLSSGRIESLQLDVTPNMARNITTQCPYAIVYSKRFEPLIQQFVTEQAQGSITVENPFTHETPQIKDGYIFPGNGIYQLPTSQQLLIWNHRIAGSSPSNVLYQDGSDPDIIILDDIEDSVKKLADVLAKNDPAACLAVAYGMLVSVRTILAKEKIDLRGALYVTGKQSAGKTTLVQRTLNYSVYRSDYRPALFLESVSTEAATRDILSLHPNQVVIIDDLCRSTERTIERTRRRLGAALLRLAANDASIEKKGRDGSNERKDCNAGLVLTAEFTLDGFSEVTRCIIINLKKQLNLTEDLNSHLTGCAVNRFVDWFADHYEKAIQLLRERLSDPNHLIDRLRLDTLDQRGKFIRERRIQNNLTLLSWAFECFVQMAKADDGLPETTERILYRKFWDGIRDSVAKQLEIIAEIRSNIAEGNLAYIISEGIDQGAFDLCKKKKELFTHAGIIVKQKHDEPTHVGLKEEALVSFVRNQNGYHDMTRSKIIQELKDIGALCLQETSCNTVHLDAKEPGKKRLPRVLLIRCKVLREQAKQYECDEEDPVQ